MKIVLAYPYKGHAPDAEVRVDDEVGRQMITDGLARPAPPEPARPARPTKGKKS